MPTDDPYRLPRTVLPSRYELDLAIDLEQATFTGSVVIDVDVTQPVDRVTLNAKGLTVTAAAVGGGDRDATVEYDPDRERIDIVPADPLPAGPARIHLSFDGGLDVELLGLYRSTFTTDGQEHAVAVTQFESTHARRAFPCFDEPDMKAVFAINLVVAEDLLAVSNAAELERTPLGDGRVRIRFADTMSMSTYLVAAVVGPLEATATRVVQGMAGPIPLRVVHPPGNAHLTEFALDVADAGIRFLEQYYDLPYPGDKVDLVAVPDFAFGAMENLGCITFREILLLVDPALATQQELQRVADVINHELAHMWFGDLVTMGWWNGIWLNEAFATFMEVMASDSFRPEWDVWTSFGLARAAAFDTDALATTRPIEFPVHSPADAEAMFDILTYEKGASVVRMLEQYLGADRFRTAIHAYLQRHAYANTETTDLWDALEETTGEPVRRIMDAWILRGGHPVVSITPTDTGVRLDQRPARSAGATAADSDDDDAVRWPVPVVLTTRSGRGTDQRRLLLEEAVDVELDGPALAARANTGGNGFFRTTSTESLRTADAVDSEAGALERFVLIDDTWAGLLRADTSAAELARLLTLAAWRETDPSVWRRLAGAVRDVRRLYGSANAAAATELARDVASAPLGHVTSVVEQGGGDLSRWQDVRGILVSLLAIVGEDAPTQAVAQEVFRADVVDGSAGHDGPDGHDGSAGYDGAAGYDGSAGYDTALRAAALEVVASTGDADVHRTIEDRWRTATNPQDRIRFLYALADTSVPDRFAHTLDLATGEVRSQDAAFLLRRALAHPDLGPQAWAHVTGHWDAIVERLPSSSLPRMLEGIRGITDPRAAEQVRSFLAEHPLPSGERVVSQHVERMWVTVAAASWVRQEIGGTG